MRNLFTLPLLLFFLAGAIIAPLSSMSHAQPATTPASSRTQMESSNNDASTKPESGDLADIKRRLSALEQARLQSEATPTEGVEEVTKLKLELQVPESLTNSYSGLGPGISKIYTSRTPHSVGAVAEVQYTSQKEGPRRTNVARFSPILGYRFSQHLIFNSGFKFDNGPTADPAGSTSLQFAYLDYLFGEETGLRMGNILIPFGALNLLQEPTHYFTVNPPLAETKVIPSQWHENGLLGFWRAGDLLVQMAVFNGPEAARFRSSSWIGSGRKGGVSAGADDIGFVIRAESIGRVGSIGASTFFSDSSQENPALARSHVRLLEAHGTLNLDRFTAKALYTEGRLSDTERIFEVTGEVLGEHVRAGHLFLAYDLFPPSRASLASPTNSDPFSLKQTLPIYVGYEHVDLHAQVAPSFVRRGDLRTEVINMGINFKPHPQVVIKTNFAHQFSGIGDDERVIETGIGVVF